MARIRLTGHRLGQYLWDTRVARTACRACALGTGQILRRTWRWVMTPRTAEDRLWRAGAPAGMLGAAGWAVAHFPAVAPTGVAAAWLIAAGFLAPREAWTMPPAEVDEALLNDAVEEAAEAPPSNPREALLDLLDEVTAGRNGVHLEELARHPGLEGFPAGPLGPLLEAHGVPVVRSLSVAGVAGRSGVRRADVEALLNPLPQGTPDAPSAPTLARPDLRKSQPLSTTLNPALAPVSAGGGTP